MSSREAKRCERRKESRGGKGADESRGEEGWFSGVSCGRGVERVVDGDGAEGEGCEAEKDSGNDALSAEGAGVACALLEGEIGGWPADVERGEVLEGGECGLGFRRVAGGKAGVGEGAEVFEFGEEGCGEGVDLDGESVEEWKASGEFVGEGD